VSTPLRDLFDDLVVHVPDVVAPPELAERAYAGSRRRRRDRALRTVSVAASVILLVALALPTTVVTELAALGRGGRQDGVDAYPRRIDVQWGIPDLPDRPGPIAAVLYGNFQFRPWPAQQGGWFAVSESGRRWQIPIHSSGSEQPPSLSRDGRLLGYLASDAGPYVVHDLVTGRRVEYAEIGRNSLAARYSLDRETPGVWSPDGHQLLLSDANRGDPDGIPMTLLLRPESRSLTAIPSDSLAGWLTTDRIGWLRNESEEPHSTPETVDFVETDVHGKELRRTRLRPSDPWRGQWLPGWNATVSPDGTQVAVRDGPESDVVRRFSVQTGEELARHAIAIDIVAARCGLSWAGHDVVVHQVNSDSETDSTATALRLRQDGIVAIAVVSPRVRAHCVLWAADAIGGSPRGGSLLGMRTATWTWWWRVWGFIAAAMIGAGLGLWAWARRARRRRLARATEAQP